MAKSKAGTGEADVLNKTTEEHFGLGACAAEPKTTHVGQSKVHLDSDGKRIPRHKPSAKSLANLKPIKKGQVLNPRGRPKDVHKVAELARSYAPEAVHRLVELMRQNENEKVALDAASRLLDRGLGKALSTKDIQINATDKAQDFISALREINARPRMDVIDGELVKEAPADVTDVEPPADDA